MSEIGDRIRSTQWIDTHEHLLEESERVAGPTGDALYPCDDWSYLVQHYAGDDLRSAGMPVADYERFTRANVDPVEKWDLFEPWWLRTRHTGYLRAATISIEQLYGLPLAREHVGEITSQMRASVKPGYYRDVLAAAGIRTCQVNSLRHTFCETEYPDLLHQDLSFIGFTLNAPDGSLDERLAGIDAAFERWGRRAVAVKNQWAYARRMLVAEVDVTAARNAYEGGGEPSVWQDFVFGYCVERATDYDLPVKLHTGYFASTNRMPLHRVRDNISDLCPLLERFGSTTFVVMHTAYPYTAEAIALAKQYSNAIIDLCWAWIIDPATTEDFLRRFLVTAPHSKVLCFGGDYYPIENVVGHAEIARRGLTRALDGLVADGFLSAADGLELVDDLMWRNAARVLPDPAGKLGASEESHSPV